MAKTPIRITHATIVLGACALVLLCFLWLNSGCSSSDDREDELLKAEVEKLRDQLRQSEQQKEQLKLRIAQGAESEEKLRYNLVANSEERLAERKNYLHSAWNVAAEAEALGRTTLKDTSAVVLALSQTYPCLWTLDFRLHIAKVADGGKWSSEWTCGLKELREAVAKWPDRPKCLVYSIGSAGNTNTFFEDRIAKLTGTACEIHIFEPTWESVNENAFKKMVNKCESRGWNFNAVGLGTKDGGSEERPMRTLPTLMKERGHMQIDVVRIECNGCEWDVLDNVNWSILKIGQLLLRIHDEKAEIPLSKLLSCFDRLHNAGFYIHSVEPVRARSSGQFEVAFIHRNWTPQSGFIEDDILARFAGKNRPPSLDNVKQPQTR